MGRADGGDGADLGEEVAILDMRKVVVYPANLDYNNCEWLSVYKFGCCWQFRADL